MSEIGWSLEAYAAHNEALRLAEEKFQSERDRRYAEVKSAEEKALKVKEEADRAALSLAREIQTYKDEKANELRSQIERERGSYVTQADLRGAVEKMEATIKPVLTYVSTQQGVAGGKLSFQQMFMVIIPTLIATLLLIGGTIVGIAYAIRDVPK